MALTLPLEMLWHTQLSFRVAFSDGSFALNMANASGDSPSDPNTGINLRLETVTDCDGVTLLLSAARFEPEPRCSADEDYHRSQERAPTTSPAGDARWLSPISGSLGEIFPPSFVDDSGTARIPSPTTFDFGLTDQDLFDSLNFGVGLPGARWEPSDDFDRLGNLKGLADMEVSPVVQPTEPVEPLSPANQWIPYSTNASAAACSSPSSSRSSPSSSSSVLDPFTPPTPQQAPRRKRPLTLDCPEPDCERSFTSQYTLTKHVRAHARKEKPHFDCSLCQMSFSRKHDRLRHEISQHRLACDWACAQCFGFFSSEVTLNKHKCKAKSAKRWS
ncbi:hypothetical protein HMN09_00149000 [Mycena chlorophos]|uniref:C2H2-type domain-containing protein n=1 Tax=Mycena chlorophos TaxID=658473 RepID=A0A8H6WMX9_MYCCL|nr:hypothetical protein HMN09_00149000 [Mycena chlorophos]